MLIVLYKEVFTLSLYVKSYCVRGPFKCKLLSSIFLRCTVYYAAQSGSDFRSLWMIAFSVTVLMKASRLCVLF